jgi:pyruvate/2-oxoglutarate dehydrogenase complex dihydrolipoamide dehydrogenase (E3) component
MTDTYDVIVLGAGSTGTNVAWYAGDNDLTVAVVERELVGGECSYWACIPSKALLLPTHALAAARRLPGAAEAVGDVDVDAVLARRDEFISHLDDSSQVQWMEGIDADLIRGEGRLSGEREVAVTAADGSVRQLTARRAVVLATGSRASLPPVDGLADIRTWDNRDVTTVKDIPERLLVLGGGVVGCEMAQVYRRLGAREVTVVERTDGLVGNFEPWAGELLAEALREDGITVLTGRSAEAASREGEDGR